jgi:hypothetical protein
MLRTKIAALSAAALIGLLSPTVASARGGFGGFHGAGLGGAGIGLGVGLGLTGAYGAYGYPFGYDYPYRYGYYGAPYAYSGYSDGSCYMVQHRIWTPYGWRFRPVQVCG